MARVGFGAGRLDDALPKGRPVREPVEVVAADFRMGGVECCWLALDFMDFDRRPVELIRRAVAASCRIPAKRVHVLTTHNHGAGSADDLDLENVARTAAAAARKAKSAAAPAWMRAAVTRLEEPLNCVRRFYVEELAGCSTLYYGACASNGFDISEFVKHQIHCLRERSELPYCGTSAEASRRVVPDPNTKTRLRPGDPAVAVFQFERENGSAIGTLCRFAAHAVCCNRPAYYSGDYPFYVRRRLRQALGGQALFLNGPCAELAPAIRDKDCGEARRIGEAVGRAAVRALAGVPAPPLARLDEGSREVELPIRDDLTGLEQAACEAAALRQDSAASKGRPLPERKRLAERIRFLDTVPFLRKKWLNGEPPSTEARRRVAVRLGWLFLNDAGLLAFPGETFSSTGEWVRRRSGIRGLVTVTEHGRTVMYVPPARDRERGGYEPTCCMTAPDAEAILAEAALAVVHERRRG